MFIPTFSTIGKIWKKTKYPNIDEWITKLWSVYTMKDYAAPRKKQNHKICSNMDAIRGYHDEWRQSE